jgi:hypothetical protein
MTVHAVGGRPGSPGGPAPHGWVWIAAKAGAMAKIVIAAVEASVTPGPGTGHYND